MKFAFKDKDKNVPNEFITFALSDPIVTICLVRLYPLPPPFKLDEINIS